MRPIRSDSLRALILSGLALQDQQARIALQRVGSRAGGNLSDLRQKTRPSEA